MSIIKYIYLLVFLSFTFHTYGQGFSDFSREVTVESVPFYTTLEHKDSLWYKQVYYVRHMQLYMYGRYKDSACTMATDTFYYFYPGGSLKELGKYIEGKKEGIWLSYYKNGMLQDSITYVADKLVKNSFSWHENGYLADSAAWLPDGTGSSVKWSKDGTPYAAGHYSAPDQKHGIWKFYHKNGRISSSELYQYGVFKDAQYFDENGNSIPEDSIKTKVEIEASYPGGLTAWLNFVGKTTRYPSYAQSNNIQGAVKVQFVVDTLGNVTNVKAIEGDSVLAKEAVRVIKKSRKWNPAYLRGIKVKSYKIQSIRFSNGNED